ncbi:MAG: 2,3-bisphosphoglycerate-independent phosphoglycerate mutase [Candidatus Woesearchaeota archaeon]|nr:2,3-bisphosphoglycerate-independent phosphoglycerate mutase [Candidatus Woesearchaeota archaeon]
MNKVALIVLDGWGVRSNKKSNAIVAAKPHFFHSLITNNLFKTLHASGTAVGLPKGTIGNSEVGHLHISAGRVITQELELINREIKSGAFYRNTVLLNAIKRAKNSRLHFIGLVSDGGVHSHVRHLFALMNLARKHGLSDVVIHAITDGRDVAQKSACIYLKQIERKLESGWKIGSLIGRWYAMDRDKRWNREQKAYSALVNETGMATKNWKNAIHKSYARGKTDEFVKPIITAPDSRIRDGDVVIFFNYRADRARELVDAFVKEKFSKFKRNYFSKLHFVCMTEHSLSLPMAVAYPHLEINNSLGEVISKRGLKQMRIAETEKWAHVTYFFNGLSNKVFKGEKRVLIPSPKVSTYDLVPAMKAKEIANVAIKSFANNIPFTLINFANADMVGHTAKMKPCMRAIKAVDAGLKKIVTAALKQNVEVIITADHGNAEQLAYADGSPMTSHTNSPVPFIIVSSRFKKLCWVKNAGLANVAPTVLKIMGLPKPREMSAKALV